MANKIIIGNIKMNMKFDDISGYIEHFKNIKNNNLVICPSYIYIPYFLNYNFHVGSQNVCIEEDGGYTGEVAAHQLHSLGVKYTIIGHSERRGKLKETDIEINKKIKSALKSHLKVILCVGETEEEKNLLKKDIVLRRQLRNALIDVEDLNNIIIAYEPVWSVGTNKLPSIDELNKTIIYIKDLIYNMHKKNIKVIYGGSINEKNIETLNKIKELDGFLIGSASINPTQFIQIIEKIS